ncbi:TraR/DksA family transcriptional regulator [Parerythrobacter jejuensis]|uniref:TraR/DksA family transcriptional regulator n=1 Tax=Parerythrobacter jejuensis TaxID=795812 RepID=A0A845AQE0_9SPHN|nr:TraR/DksA C4-type zinc finger protein [Parerythrobacter jejuensis]MXP31115.1 TraR/DksA family transcriptional regulator [Parerythrobacter jejuensis]MXP33875.1 TraR/DksA family transcriptional regulator [Parerythrobacter jejuensis]
MTEEEARTALRTRQAELEQEDRISAEGREPVTLQQDSVGRLSRMDAMQQQAMAQAQERRRTAERARITAALARLEEGEWGYCAHCGEEIAEQRLRHDPSVPRCVSCANDPA